MKKILLLIGTVGLLASTGCIFPRGDDRRDDRHPSMGHDDHSRGADHGEYPGDMGHDPDR